MSNSDIRYCILIPTINRKDLLVEALDWYITNLPVEILVLDNGKQGLVSGTPKLKIFELEKPLGVAASWNWLVNRAIERGFEYFLILNDDVILKRYPAEIHDVIDANADCFTRARPFYNWSAFILSKAIFNEVGNFDENFERCFFEDNDYEYRLKLAGIRIAYNDTICPDVYVNSGSTQVNPELGDFLGNREYYIQKWGGIPNEEKYTTPFNK